MASGSMKTAPIKEIFAPTYTADIFIAGDPVAARQICQEFALDGLCVNFSECEFIYTGGRETGLRIGLINYPRFPGLPMEIFERATELARILIVGLHQSSASVVGTDQTVFLSRRAE